MELTRDFNVNIRKKAEYVCRMSGDSLIGYVPKHFTKRSPKRKKDELNEIFQTAFSESEEKGLKNGEQIAYINERMRELYKEHFFFADLIEIVSFDKDFTKYIQERLKKMLVAKLMRVSRFKEKARLHCWNYFITQTYDSAKYASENEFKEAYLTCLSHLCTDHGWRVMGVFERGKKSNRLHFHGVAYIPAGRMKGFMKPTKYYNEISHKVEKSTINSFFAVRFGRNDFQDITKQNGIEGISNYIVKYILKSDEKVYYSRGIDGSITLELCDEDIVCGYKVPYGEKFLVFDCVMYGTILDCRRQYEVS